jgi:hypothetical protein
MIAKLICGVALLAVACSPALAQLSLGNGQVLTIGPNGQVTSGSMPTDAKMIKMMHQRGHTMKSVMVWMDENGRMRVCDCGENDRH